MELINHYRVVSFSPVPESVEPVNVAVLVMDSRPRLISDFKFQKLACVAPYFNRDILEFWLKDLSEEISLVPPREFDKILSIISSRTAQVKVGVANYVSKSITKTLEEKLLGVYLKRPDGVSKPSEDHMQYVDTLIDDVVECSSLVFGEILKRARPNRFLKPESVSLLPTSNVKFSRVINSPHALILMDGINLAVASRAQLRQRAAEIDFGFFAFSGVKDSIARIEGKEITRASFVFNKPAISDVEVDYIIKLVSQDADQAIDSSDQYGLQQFNKYIHESSRFL